MGKHHLLGALASSLALAVLPGQAAAGAGADLWAMLAAMSAEARGVQVGRELALEVDLAAEASPAFSFEPGGEARYAMGFNNVSEGWSWRELAEPAKEDYYRFKYFPLEAAVEDKGRYGNWNPFEGGHQVTRHWRYEYFLAFDNLYDFYPRTGDEQAGFVVPAGQEAPRLRVLAALVAPVVRESNTFWKSTGDKKDDYTLRKRYLLGRLDAVCYLDGAGKLMTMVRPLSCAPGGTETGSPRCLRKC